MRFFWRGRFWMNFWRTKVSFSISLNLWTSLQIWASGSRHCGPRPFQRHTSAATSSSSQWGSWREAGGWKRRRRRWQLEGGGPSPRQKPPVSAKSDHMTTLAVQQTKNKTRHFEAFWQNQSTHRRVWGDPGTPSVKLLIKDPTLDLCLLLPHLMRESLQRNT